MLKDVKFYLKVLTANESFQLPAFIFVHVTSKLHDVLPTEINTRDLNYSSSYSS